MRRSSRWLPHTFTLPRMGETKTTQQNVTDHLLHPPTYGRNFDQISSLGYSDPSPSHAWEKLKKLLSEKGYFPSPSHAWEKQFHKTIDQKSDSFTLPRMGETNALLNNSHFLHFSITPKPREPSVFRWYTLPSR